MIHSYEIISVDKETSTFVIRFEGREAFNFNVPFLDGSYLSGEQLDLAIQLMCPYTQEEFVQEKVNLLGWEAIEALVKI